jgi:predicted transcriptional regulator
MEIILKSGFEKILALFYQDKSAKIHLRDIARKTKLNENSAFRFLKELEKSKLLLSRKDGNLKKYELQKNEKVYSVLTYFDVIKLNKLPNLRRKAILYFLDNLKDKPVIAFVFGSTAKNTYKEQSDVDILLIVNKKIDTKESEKYADAQTGIRISCFQITFHEFIDELKLKHDHVIQAAISTGYPVTNHIEYYRMINHERI